MPYDFGPRGAANFPARCAALAAKYAPRGGAGGRALDIGCAVGGASFELARTFDAVTGLDFSSAFIAAARRLAAGERLPCTALDEGTLSSWFVAASPPGVDAARVHFRTGDACALQAQPLGGRFDAVLASNLLCRLPDPDAFLRALPTLLTADGVAVVISPYSWLTEYTPQERWLGGVVRGGDAVHSAPAFIERMGALGLQLLEECDMPFLIREHARKFQWGCSHATVWRLASSTAPLPQSPHDVPNAAPEAASVPVAQPKAAGAAPPSLNSAKAAAAKAESVPVPKATSPRHKTSSAGSFGGPSSGTHHAAGPARLASLTRTRTDEWATGSLGRPAGALDVVQSPSYLA
jgi:putative 4-mercaptohistidine N1-methyltranferase